jgi:hypothetical protein
MMCDCKEKENLNAMKFLERPKGLRKKPGYQLLGLALLTAAVSVCMLLVPTQTASAFGNGGPVTGIAGKCLENKDGTVAAGNKIQLGTCDSSTKQVWQWQGDMSMRVQDYCLDVQNSGTSPGAIVQLWSCNGTGAQRWYRVGNTLKNPNSNLCLDTVGGASANGTGVQISTCNGSAASQQWNIPSEALVKTPLFDGAAHNPLPPGPYHTPTPTITLDYSQMPQWGDYMEQVAKPFIEAWWPAMVDRYSYPEHGAMTSFTVSIDPTLAVNTFASTFGAEHSIKINPGQHGYVTRQAGMQGTIIHEMDHLMVYNDARASSGMPKWLREGLADHASFNFYGEPRPTGIGNDDTLTMGYFPVVQLLERAETESGNTFLKALSNNAWNGTFNYNLFKQVSGSTPAEHWRAIFNDVKATEVGTFVNSISGNCLDVPNFNSTSGVRVQVVSCNGSDAQAWMHKVKPGNTSGVITGYQGICIGVQGNGTAAGTAVELQNCNSGSNAGQKWELVGGTIRNPNSGKCLQTVNGSQAVGALLEIAVCSGSVEQQWTPPPVVKAPVTSVTSKVLYPATFPDGQQGIGTTDAKGNGYNRVLTAPAGNAYGKPNLSPNGTKVAFYQTVNGQQTSALRIANADGTSNTQLTTSGYFISTSAPQPLWSADNAKILVAVTPTGQTATDKQWIWLWVNADGSGQQVVSSTVIGGTPFAVANNKIYYVNGTVVGTQLCSANSSDGSGQACFGQASVPKAVALSPAADRVASLASGTTTGIQLTSVGGSTTSTISLSSLGSGLTNVTNVVWIPNTTRIAFQATVGGRNAWYVVDALSPAQINKLNIDAANPISWYANGAPELTYGSFTALAPFRITDTRAGYGGLNAGKTLTPGGTLDIQVAGLGGVPAEGASAAVLNITAPLPTSNGYLTAYPAGTTRPVASTVNTTSGKIVNNQTTVGLGTDGKVSIYNYLGNTEIVVDVVGYYSATGGTFTPTAPKRIIDSREGSGVPLSANATRDVQITGVQGIPSNAVGVVADVTQVGATAANFLTLYPSGTTAPTASSLSYSANEILTKEVTVKLGSNGALTIKNGPSGASTSHFIIDVVGYYTADMSGMAYAPINPTRIADTRAGLGYPYAGQPLGHGATKLFAISSSVMPANATGVVNNLTIASATNPTYLTAFPANVATVPSATSVTYVSPVGFNESTVSLSGGPSSGFKVYNLAGTTEVVIDSLGYYY